MAIRNAEWTGVKEIDRMLKKLPASLNARVLTTAYKNASKPTVKKMKQLAPRGKTSNLISSIGSVKVKNFKGMVTVRTGPRTGRGKYSKGYHAHLVEEGTEPHDIPVKTSRVLYDGNTFYGTAVRHPGSRAQPFAQPAIDATLPEVRSKVREEIGKAVVKTMRKQLSK